MQFTVLLKSYEEDIKQIPSGSNSYYFLGDFSRQTIETSKRWPNFFNFQSTLQLPRGLGGKEMARLALKLGHEEIAL